MSGCANRARTDHSSGPPSKKRKTRSSATVDSEIKILDDVDVDSAVKGRRRDGCKYQGKLQRAG